MPLSEAIDRNQREVRKMLVIDGVELVLVDELLEMRKFERDHALRHQQMRHAGDKVVEVWHLCQHVVADDEVSVLAFRRKLLREAEAEELDECWNILLPRHFGDIDSRLNPR